MPYNGWSNYETWLVKLWMDNDEGSYLYWQERAQEVYDDDHDTAESNLADEVKEQHEQMAEEIGIPSSGVFSDLMTAALGEVDWREIASSLLEGVNKEPEEVEVASDEESL